eukprot:TRINITY_DN1993_c0_g1_i3.p1 TRINITY_DN1993_c0_g1~~TRINITY_DN1993_c0_g1_i3.p1  ORF type:complete len:336 (-),score=53.97 TRINITY_DN1993_c0_g1_i3:61-1068(-)
MNICIDLVNQGLELRFSPVSQRLELIRIYDLTSVRLIYGDSDFSSRTPTFLSVHSKFGPTSAGHYSDSKETYMLHYPGITFVFSVPEELLQEQKIKEGKMPEFDSVMLSCMHMFVSDEKDPRLIKPMPILGKPLVLLPSQGILFSETNSMLIFGNTPQDALTILGSPQHISYKKSNPLSIHERLHIRDKAEVRDFQYDYFYNYFDIGLDILFDAANHNIKKFIVHTNFPTHPNFNLYQKCNFTIVPPAAQEMKHDEKDDDGFEDFDEEAKVITPEMKWPEISECYGKALTEPFFMPPTKDNPFGGSRYYAHKDIILEVMENDYISSVTLFRSHDY